MPYNDNTSDLTISDQALEHLEKPSQAINELYLVLKPGGIAIPTTCFLNYLHFFPQDLWRFSPDILKYLCGHFSQKLNYAEWGN
jgi:ubiquinone/menaquinone biosynthesis C-methylase UbiE